MPRAARAKDTKTAAKENEKTKKKGEDQHVVSRSKTQGFFCNRHEDFNLIFDFLEHILKNSTGTQGVFRLKLNVT